MVSEVWPVESWQSRLNRLILFPFDRIRQALYSQRDQYSGRSRLGKGAAFTAIALAPLFPPAISFAIEQFTLATLLNRLKRWAIEILILYLIWIAVALQLRLFWI